MQAYPVAYPANAKTAPTVSAPTTPPSDSQESPKMISPNPMLLFHLYSIDLAAH